MDRFSVSMLYHGILIGGLLMKVIHVILVLCTFILAVGCGTTQQQTKPDNNQMPAWVLSGGSSDKETCYVGSSRPHIKGLPYQKALAVSRAIDGIARQKNVTVDVEVESLMKGTSSGASTSLSSYSVQTTTGQKVSAKITDVWMNSYSNEIFVRMCEK